MTISLKHTFASAKSDGTDSTLVQPSNWNAEHTITLAAGKVLGRDTSAAGAMQELPLAFDSSGNATVSATGSFTPPVGTTAQRPGTPATGMMRYNTSTTAFEGYNGSAWGNLTPASASVASINFGSTGLTPNTATTGAVSVAGTLAVANGGTGLASAGALGNVLTSDGTNWTSSASSGGGSPVGSIAIQPKISARVLAASGTGSTATVYLVPSCAIPVGSLITVAGVTPSGYNAANVAVTASSTLSFSATGSISGTTLTVSSVTGTVSIGQEIFGASVNGNSYITSGSGTTWTLNRSQTVSSTTITGNCGTASYANTTTAAVTVLGTITVTPSGYLPCDGSIYTRSSYSTLAGYIGTPVGFSAASIASTFSAAAAAVNGPTLHRVNNVLFCNGTADVNMAASATASAYRTSTDNGVTFALNTGFSINGSCGVVYGNGVYVQGLWGSSGYTHSIAYGSSATAITSKATVFTSSGIYTAQNPAALAFGNGLFLYCGWAYEPNCYNNQGVYIYSSSNGTSWTQLSVPLAGYNPGLYGSTGGFLATSANRTWHSTTGASWTEITSTFSGNPQLSAGNGIFVVTTATGFYTSSSGASGTWNLMPTPRGIIVPANYLLIGQQWIWTGNTWVSNYGYMTVDFVNFSTMLVSGPLNFVGSLGAVTNGNLNYLGAYPYTQVYLIPKISYTTSTQFPVPNLSSAFAGTNQVMGGASEGQYFIKT